MSYASLKSWLKEKDPALYELYLLEQRERKRRRAREYQQRVAKGYREHVLAKTEK